MPTDSAGGLSWISETVAAFLSDLSSLAWSLPLIFLLLGAGMLFTFRLGFLQLRVFFHALAVISGRYDDPRKTGDITHFQALCAALSATVGVGNIAGVATAIHWGGPGAVFWMWVAGFFGMATKYATCTLSQKYRKVNPDGTISGGPMYYIQLGLGKKFRWLAVVFAVSTVIASFGGGNMVQSSEMARAATDELAVWLGRGAVRDLLYFELTSPEQAEQAITPLRVLLGLLVSGLVGLVIIGGIRRIGQVAAKLVPLMSILYCAGALFILVTHLPRLTESLALIVKSAFHPAPMTAGVAGASFLAILTWGIKRAVFSNEAGLGSAPIAHAAAKTDEPVREGLVAMLGPFIDTLVICTMTALVIIVSGDWRNFELDGSVLTKTAFQTGIPWGNGVYGGTVVSLGLILFAVSTAISWSYYGDRCTEYLFGARAVPYYRWLFVVFVFLGAILKIQAVWDFADFTMATMAFWNLIGVIGLSGVIISLSRDYLNREHIPYRWKDGSWTAEPLETEDS